MLRTSHLKHTYPAGTEFRDVGDCSVAWQFSAGDEEYVAVREQAGVFDYFALGLIRLRGDVAPFLQAILARDVEYLTPERCMMTLLLDDDGEPRDLLTVYGMEDGALVETSVGLGTATYEFLRQAAPPDVEVEWLSDTHSVVGVEGPYAWGIVGRLLDSELTGLPFESVVETVWRDHPVFFSRSGFTGEYGYKVIAPLDVVADLWQEAITHAVPIGYKTLETTMLEVRQPVLHREVRPGWSVESTGLNWLVDISKEDFAGRDAVMAEFSAGTDRGTIGWVAADPGTPIAAAGSVVRGGGTDVGEVVWATQSPALGAIGLARISADLLAAGLELDLAIDGEEVPIRTVSSPYVIPKSWSVPVF